MAGALHQILLFDTPSSSCIYEETRKSAPAGICRFLAGDSCWPVNKNVLIHSYLYYYYFFKLYKRHWRADIDAGDSLASRFGYERLLLWRIFFLTSEPRSTSCSRLCDCEECNSFLISSQRGEETICLGAVLSKTRTEAQQIKSYSSLMLYHRNTKWMLMKIPNCSV
jgi:hypothetical protein